ncbi:flagellar biosynthetic protein FliO [Pseudokineococcus basanitobsidens]|uniref:Flagellar biosynthetic protein FliO n=1 Tax=Pseudokineococcus basanitobsidens TaxID=1926649 RepID=A0ABU8RGC6_9ACTN
MDTPDALGLLLRVAGSLVAVVGLVWMVRRGMLRSGGSRARAAVGSISVLARQQLSGRTSVVLVQVGSTGLVLGVSDSSVAVLAQRPVDELLARPAEPAPAPSRPARSRVVRREPVVLPASATTSVVPAQRRPADAAASAQETAGPLAGSALSPATWAQAVDVVRGRTARR